MVDQNCAYCVEGELLAKFGIKICELENSKVYLFKEQSHPGRVVLAYKDHVSEQFEIPEADYVRFMLDVRKVGEALKEVFHPAKINFGAYSDTLKHAHWHIVPKYEGEFEFGGVFAMNPKQTYLTDAAYAERIEQIRKAIQG